jgi:hypothetical protein
MSMKLNQAQRRIVNEHQVYHIIRSFLTVSETGEKALPLLYSSTKTTFANYVSADSDLTDDMKTAAMLGNRNSSLTGLKLWTRAKDYKRNFINKYQPIKNNDPTPSGTSNDDDIIDLVRKKVWLKREIEAAKGTELDPPTSFEACPQTFQPVDFFAYTKLHDHVKLQIAPSNKRNYSDPESGTNELTVRSQTISRKQQRTMDKVLREPNGTSPTTGISRFGGADGMQEMMQTKQQATRFNQKFNLAKFCVEQGIRGGTKMIEDMMEDENKKTAKLKSTDDDIDLNSDLSSDED